MESKTVLVIEDEPTINRMVSSYFKASSFTVLSAIDGKQALSMFRNNSVDLICLDIMIPNIDGWIIAEIIRKESSVPIIIMSALSEEEDILKGYSLNVDDYITKPFNPKILIAKAKRLLCRQDDEKTNETITILRTNHLIVDLNTHKILLDKIELNLSKTEFDLLHYFIKNEGRICSRNQLLDEIWGIDVYVEDRIVDTYVKRLRKHLGSYSFFIKTIFGVGYRFETIDQKDI